jgi:hypothetical protein
LGCNPNNEAKKFLMKWWRVHEMQDDKVECSIIKWKKILDDETKRNSLSLAFGEGNSAFIKTHAWVVLKNQSRALHVSYNTRGVGHHPWNKCHHDKLHLRWCLFGEASYVSVVDKHQLRWSWVRYDSRCLPSYVTRCMWMVRT